MGCGASASAAKYSKMVDEGKDEDRAKGAKGLGDFPPSEETAVVLVKALVDEKEEVRKAAFETLEKYGLDGAVLVAPKLREIIKSELQPLDKQGFAFAALQQIALKIDASLVLPLLEEILLKDGHAFSQPAKQLLLQLGEKAKGVIEKIVPVLAKKGVDVSLRTDQKLEFFKYLASLAGAGLPVVPELLIMLWSADSDTDARKAALSALKVCGPDLAPKAVPDILQVLQDDSKPDDVGVAELRCLALIVLGVFGEKASDAVPEIIKHIDTDFRPIALDSLSQLGKTAAPALARVISLLGEVFLSPGCGVDNARKAVAIIQNIGLPEAASAIPVLTPLCGHEDADLKAEAAQCVRALGGEA